MKYLGMLGMAVTMLSFMACSESETSAEGNSLSGTADGKRVPFRASIDIAKKKSSALAKASLSDDEEIVVTSWDEGEQVALVYTGCNDEECEKDTLIFKITDVSEDGVATIEGSVPEDKYKELNLDDITLVFPATAADKDETSFIKKDLLKSQLGLLEGEGSISELFDVRKGTGSIIKKEDYYTLDGIVDMVNQNAIFKLTTKAKSDSEEDLKNIDVESLSIFFGETEYQVIPEKGESELSEFYVALPEVNEELVSFVARSSDNHQYGFSKKLSFSAGTYYPCTLKMKDYGESVALLRISIENENSESGVEADALTAHLGESDYAAVKYGENKFFLMLPAMDDASISFDFESGSSVYKSNSLKINLEADKNNQLDVSFGDFNVNGTVSGKDGMKIEDVEVRLLKRDLSTKTDADGKFTIEGKNIKKYRFNENENKNTDDTIRFVAEGYDTLSIVLNTLDTTLSIWLEPTYSFGYALKNRPRPSKGCGTTSKLQKTRSVENGDRFEMMINGEKREYFITLPKNYDNKKPYKLLFAMHCMGSNAEDFVHHSPDQDHPSPYYGQQKLDTEGNYIFVSPRGDTDGMPWSMSSDKDHVFIDQLLTTLEENYCIDTSRVFMTGFSFGAMVTNSIAQDMQDRLRAVAVYATADKYIYLPQNKGLPIAWMAVHGKNDGTCEYNLALTSALPRILKNNGKPDAEGNFTDASAEKPKEVGGSGHLCYDFTTVDERFPVKFCSWNGQHQWTAYDNGNWQNTWVPEEVHKFFEQF